MIKTFSCMFILVFIIAVTPLYAQEKAPLLKMAEKDTIPNTPVVVQNIYIIGNKQTRESIILRELNFEVGGNYRKRDLIEVINRDEQKVFNLRLFNTVSIQLIDTGDNLVDVLIQVTERWYTFPIPLFKLSDRNFNDWWVNRDRDLSRVNYGIKLFRYNMRGRNERLRLIAQTGFTNEFELNYRIPYISKKQKEGLIVNFAYRDRKNLAYVTENHLPLFTTQEDKIFSSFNASASYSFRASFYSFHYITLGYNNVQVADTVLSLNPNYMAGGKNQNQYLTLGYQFIRDLRDFINYPLNGFYLNIRTNKIGVGFYEDVDLWRTSVQYSHYFDLGKNWYASATATGSISLPFDQPYMLFDALGFEQNLIRGYELDVIEGPRYLIAKTNLRKRIIDEKINLPWMMFEQFKSVPIAVYAKLFFDAGRVENYPIYNENLENQRLSNRILYGVGAGIDIVSFYDFVVRPEYSLNSEGKFNFFLNFRADF